MPRTSSGRRHEIFYERGVADGMLKTRATCVCGTLDAPARFGKERAEQDAHDHMESSKHISQRVKNPRRRNS